MSVYDLFFAFGPPGSYFLDSRKTYKARGVPDNLNDALFSKGWGKIHSIAWNDRGAAWAVWEDGDCKHRTYQSSALDTMGSTETLASWMEGCVKTKCKVWFGCGGSFVAHNDRESRLAHGISSECEEDTREKEGEGTEHKVFALGVGDLYVTIWKDGSVMWHCRRSYPELHYLLSAAKRGDIVFVALNPYRANEFFLALADGTVHISMSAAYQEDIAEVLEKEGIPVSITSLTRASQDVTSSVPRNARRGKLLSTIIKTVGGGAVQGFVGPIVAAAVACSVM